MKMLRLRDECWVASDQVLRVEVVNDRITVTMRDGYNHSIGADYGKGVYATMDRLINEINAAEEK